MIKTCKKCKLEKDYKEFLRTDRNNKPTLGYFCDDCKVKSIQSKEYFREYRYNRRHNDPLFNMIDRVRSLLYKSIVKSKGYSKKSETYKILGCDYEFFYNYIEKQFKDGMNWSNIHLDHIKPISLAVTEEDVLKLNHYTNFQPLFAIDNLKKSNKYSEDE